MLHAHRLSFWKQGLSVLSQQRGWIAHKWFPKDYRKALVQSSWTWFWGFVKDNKGLILFLFGSLLEEWGYWLYMILMLPWKIQPHFYFEDPLSSSPMTVHQQRASVWHPPIQRCHCCPQFPEALLSPQIQDIIQLTVGRTDSEVLGNETVKWALGA